MFGGMIDFTEYFREEKDVWVRNIGDEQISLEFDTGNGNKIPKCIQLTGDPENLTLEVPWDAIKNSHDFRIILRRAPPALVVMTYDQVEAHFRQKAERRGITIEEAVAQAEARRQRDRAPPDRLGATVDEISGRGRTETQREFEELQQGGTGSGSSANLGKHGVVQIRDVVHPRVLHLCNQVTTDVDPQDRMPAREMLDELEAIRGRLKLEDANHIMSFGFHTTVKKFGQALAAEVSKAAMDEMDAAEAQETEARAER